MALMRLPSIRIVASSAGVRPVPSITRTWVRAVTPADWAGAAASDKGAIANNNTTAETRLQDVPRSMFVDCSSSPDILRLRVRYSARGALAMWLALAIILILLWVGGFLLFHIAAFALHILLIVAAVALVIHLLGGRRRAA